MLTQLKSQVKRYGLLNVVTLYVKFFSGRKCIFMLNTERNLKQTFETLKNRLKGKLNRSEQQSNGRIK